MTLPGGGNHMTPDRPLTKSITLHKLHRGACLLRILGAGHLSPVALAKRVPSQMEREYFLKPCSIVPEIGCKQFLKFKQKSACFPNATDEARCALASTAQESIFRVPEVISIRLCRYDLWKYFQT